MAIATTYPGVYIEEIPSGERTITGVATSIAAFVGRARRGPTNEPRRVQSFGEFARRFGGLWAESTMSYAVQQYFMNGGADALIVRVVHDDAVKATFTLAGSGGADDLTLEAASEGDWGDKLRVRVDHNTRDAEDGESEDEIFNLTVYDAETGDVETHRNVSVNSSSSRYVTSVLEDESALVRVSGNVPAKRPEKHTDVPIGTDPFSEGAGYYAESNDDGEDGSDIEAGDVADANLEADKKGLWALEKADLFNLLCIPPLTWETDLVTDDTTILEQALPYCEKRRAILLVDSPASWTSKDAAVTGMGTLNMTNENAAMYFPRVKMADPLKENRLNSFAPCGVVAGVIARTDAQRGVWKAPAGIETALNGVRELTVKLTDGENGQLNPLGLNCLRSFPAAGHVVWGARTREGDDRLASEWKYLPVRRLALFIEESLYRGTQWVVFEPNDEPLWAQIRMSVGSFMHRLFRQGAFQGKSPSEAYLVKCDSETTTQDDINQGKVNVIVGFAPLKPAEFVILKITQLVGQDSS